MRINSFGINLFSKLNVSNNQKQNVSYIQTNPIKDTVSFTSSDLSLAQRFENKLIAQGVNGKVANEFCSNEENVEKMAELTAILIEPDENDYETFEEYEEAYEEYSQKDDFQELIGGPLEPVEAMHYINFNMDRFYRDFLEDTYYYGNFSKDVKVADIIEKMEIENEYGTGRYSNVLPIAMAILSNVSDKTINNLKESTYIFEIDNYENIDCYNEKYVDEYDFLYDLMSTINNPQCATLFIEALNHLPETSDGLEEIEEAHQLSLYCSDLVHNEELMEDFLNYHIFRLENDKEYKPFLEDVSEENLKKSLSFNTYLASSEYDIEEKSLIDLLRYYDSIQNTRTKAENPKRVLELMSNVKEEDKSIRYRAMNLKEAIYADKEKLQTKQLNRYLFYLDFEGMDVEEAAYQAAFYVS